MILHHLRIAAFAAFSLCAASSAALATEGASQYPDGAESFMAGAVPPPGFYFLNYVTHYSADRLNDSGGNKLPIDFSLRATAEVARLVWTSPYKVFGAHWGMQVIAPMVNLDYKVAGASHHQFGLGDVTLSPAILSWHWQHLHVAASLDIFAPTGKYDKALPLNIGANYWGFEPVLAATYITDGGFEVSAKLMYDINTRNEDTDYRSGQAFHMDYAVTQHWNNLSFGVVGYVFVQTTEDNRAGVTVDNRARAFAIGPGLKYDFKGVSMIGKWQHDYVADNRPMGDKFWLKLIVPL